MLLKRPAVLSARATLCSARVCVTPGALGRIYGACHDPQKHTLCREIGVQVAIDDAGKDRTNAGYVRQYHAICRDGMKPERELVFSNYLSEKRVPRHFEDVSVFFVGHHAGQNFLL